MTTKNTEIINAIRSKFQRILSDPAAIRTFLAQHRKNLMIALAAILVLTLAVSCAGGGGFEESVEQYILGIATQDGEILAELLPDAMLKAMVDEDTGYGSREELIRYLGKYGGREFGYGIVEPLSLEIRETSSASKDDLAQINEDLAELGEEIGKQLRATDAKSAQVMVEFNSQLFGRQTTIIYVMLYKIGGDWCYLPM